MSPDEKELSRLETEYMVLSDKRGRLIMKQNKSQNDFLKLERLHEESYRLWDRIDQKRAEMGLSHFNPGGH